jgi:hypothetical protein
MIRRLLVIGIVGATLGCASEERPKPPDYSPGGTESGNTLTCDGLREANATVDKAGRFSVDGGQAACMLTGLECTLARCDGGMGWAKCAAGYWVYFCADVFEGGKDARMDVEDGAQGGDAGAD